MDYTMIIFISKINIYYNKMTKNIIKLIIYVLILLYVYILLRYIYFNTIIYKCKYITTDQSKDIAETGDLILFRCNMTTVEDAIIQFNSFFSHCGIVVEYNNNKYILEIVRKGDHDNYNKNNNNVNMIEFVKRVNDYNGETYIIKYNDIVKEEHKNKLLDNIYDYFNLKYDTNIKYNYTISILKNIIGIKNINKYNDYMFCSEFCYKILTDIGLLNNSMCNKCLNPLDIYNLNIYNKEQFYKITK